MVKEKEKNIKALITFINPVRNAIEDAANLPSVSEPVHGIQVWASGVI